MEDRDRLIECHEEEFARAFIDKARRAQFYARLSRRKWRQSKDPKKRGKWSEIASNFEHWGVDHRYVFPVPVAEQAVQATLIQLRSLGAPDTCYVISHSRQVDRQLMRLDDALAYLDRETVYGTILSCVPGQLAYYQQAECLGLTWILRK